MARKVTLENQKPVKRKTTHESYGGGRPPVDPWNKLSISVRAMVTPRVGDVLASLQAIHGFQEPPHGRVSSDLLRLAVFRLIEEMVKKDPTILGEITWEELVNDPSWNNLKMAGLA